MKVGSPVSKGAEQAELPTLQATQLWAHMPWLPLPGTLHTESHHFQ